MNASNGRPVTATTQDERIVRDPDVLLGKPIVRGTRVPVYIIVGLVENGQTSEEIVDDYPDLTIEDVDAAIAFAAHSPVSIDLPAR
jgi:uncharacterized protein (DUF433 family)